MAMVQIWLTAAADAAYQRLQDAAPAQAVAVTWAISQLDAPPHHRIDLPGAPEEAPFLVEDPGDPDAPVLIYRRTIAGEPGDWLVVSLMSREDYEAARKARRALAAAPPAVRDFVNSVLGTVASVTASAVPGPVDISVGGAVPSTEVPSPPEGNS